MSTDIDNVCKVRKVITSCQTHHHFEVALKMMCQLKHYWQWWNCYNVFISAVIKCKSPIEDPLFERLINKASFEHELRLQKHKAGL